MRGVRLIALLCALCPAAACGYMDSELALNDKAYAMTFEDDEALTGEQLLELDELHISGRRTSYDFEGGIYGCGGGGFSLLSYGHRAYRAASPRIKPSTRRGPVVIVGSGWDLNPSPDVQEDQTPAPPTPQELLMEHTTQGSRYFIEHAKVNLR